MTALLRTAKKKGKPRGRPFPKGVSGNPGGRPKGLAEFRLAVQEYSEEALNQLIAILRSKKSDPLAATRVKAIRELFDRAWGRPVQELAVQGSLDVKVASADPRETAKRMAFLLARGAAATEKERLPAPKPAKKKVTLPA